MKQKLWRRRVRHLCAFCATDLMTADKLTTKYQLDANGEEDRSLPAPESYQGDNDGEATAIAPVIHTIDRDGTER